MGWLKAVVVVAVSLCVAQVALLKESGSQSDIYSVHTPSNPVVSVEWTGCVVTVC